MILKSQNYSSKTLPILNSIQPVENTFHQFLYSLKYIKDPLDILKLFFYMLNVQNKEGQTPFHLFFKMIPKNTNYFPLLDLFKQNNADPEIIDSYGKNRLIISRMLL